MRMRNVGAVAVVLLASVAGLAQQPKVSHAQMSTRGGENLQREIGAAQAATWLGYTVPATHWVNSGWGDNVLHLEGDDQQIVSEPDQSANVPPAMILLRVTAGKVDRVLIEQTDREVDAGGLPFVWLTGVSPADSVKTLKSVVEASIAEEAKASAEKAAPVVTTDRERARIERDVQRAPERELHRVTDRGMTAIALTNVPEASAALKDFTAVSYPLTVRDKAAFWLANERGSEGFRTDAALLKGDKDDAFREKLVFDLTLVKGESRGAAIDALIAAAKTDSAQKVRSQAQFWLAQMAVKKGDPKITRALNDSAKDDPEVAIRKSAVFAISRLPEDQAVPELIQVASTSKDATTRKEAIFWLGRSKDPRALEFLEKVVRQ